MENLRVESDASVINDKVGIGYVLYDRKERGFDKILTDSQELDEDFTSEVAEQIAILRGLSIAREYYTGGNVVAFTDCKVIVDRVRNSGIFSYNQKVRRSLSVVTSSFDNVLIRWIPSEENKEAHNACRSVFED
jgi:ribonuclease HI